MSKHPRKHSFPVRRHTYDQAVYVGAALGYKLRGEEAPEHVLAKAKGLPFLKGAGGWGEATTGEKASLGLLAAGGVGASLLFWKGQVGLATLVLFGTLAVGAVAEGSGKKAAA